MPLDKSGPPVGILMLDSRFPRIPGDIGNPASFSFPVSYKIVPDASPQKVVKNRAEGLLDSFIDAGQTLVNEGVCGITTSCGFLSLFQEELNNALSVPVLTSSLMQVNLINKMLPETKRVGILTISASNLTEEHLQLADVPLNTPIGSTEGGQEFTRAILENLPELDVDKARQDNIDAAQDLYARHPELGAIVLECTNMTPYAKDMAEALNLPVFSIIDFICWFHAAVSPRSYN
ncbi:MAG: aspartate/glutamate racemase family protein [Pseudomonadota bacterium]